MIGPDLIQRSAEVESAQHDAQPVVALETTFLVHGLPAPHNLETAAAIAETIRTNGAVPAFVGINHGCIRIGLDALELEEMAHDGAAQKASRRDLAALLASGSSGATTVAGTMVCAALAAIEVFATGGIGGVHHGYESSMDVSADLIELGRTPVAVVCSGIKSILDIPRTLEFLETQGVPVIGYGVDELPAFYLRDYGLAVDYRIDTPHEVAKLINTSRYLGNTGVLIANPIPERAAIDRELFEQWHDTAQRDAARAGVKGKSVTPFLLERIFELSAGMGIEANKSLLIDNARVGALIACALASR